jgi:acid stress chaperone HdeB
LVAGEVDHNRACAWGRISFATASARRLAGRADRRAEAPPMSRCHMLMEIFMKTIVAMLFTAGLPPAPAEATVLDLSTMTCKQFVEGGEDEIKMVLTWLDGWYNGDEDEAIIDTDVFVANAKKFGSFCAANPTISIVTAADRILGK